MLGSQAPRGPQYQLWSLQTSFLLAVKGARRVEETAQWLRRLPCTQLTWVLSLAPYSRGDSGEQSQEQTLSFPYELCRMRPPYSNQKGVSLKEGFDNLSPYWMVSAVGCCRWRGGPLDPSGALQTWQMLLQEEGSKLSFLPSGLPSTSGSSVQKGTLVAPAVLATGRDRARRATRASSPRPT